MYLKSLEVHGFKSFANKLLFEFHHGITAIVGPNGSGKSNVADAVRWVLGEQSAKQLRGAKMEDVIFAGTQLRKPLGFAYVAITINNEDHKLNVPYEEVKIARRVYRSGESEYLLNGASCRLKDIQELLFDTGIGKEGYSIIGQGQIDKILSGKPEERRELFDEAAGIVKYKKRKAAAEKNLEEERQNLVRIEDILSELEKQVGPLEKQSEKAKEYLKYRDELRNLDVNMFLMDYERIHGEIEDISGKQIIADRDLNQAKVDFEKSKQQYEQSEEVLEQKSQELESDKERLSTDKVQLNTYESEIRILNEQINAVHQSEAHYNEQMVSLKEKLENLANEQKNYQEQKEQYQAQIDEISGNRSDADQQMKELAERISECEQEMARCQNEIITFMDMAAEIRTEEQRFRSMMEQNTLKRAELTQRVLKYKSEASVMEDRMEQEKKVLLDLADKITAMNHINEELDTTLKALRKESENLSREHRDVQQQFHMENSRMNSLKNMTERYEGFGQSIKRVMEQKAQYPGIVGVVADIIRVKKEYEIAVETALGGSIQNIVTDNEQTAKSMIQYLKKNRFGRATFLPLTNIQTKTANNARNIMSEPGVIGMASTLVEADEKFTSLVEYLLGRFVVVDHIDHAIALAKKYHHTIRIVTTEGDLLNPGGSMSGGAFKNSNNLLGRRREMDDLEQRVETLKNRLQEIAKSLEKSEKEQQDIMKKLADNANIRHDLNLRQNTAKINYDRANADLEARKEELDLIQLDGQEVESRKEELNREMGQIDSRLEENTKQREEKEKRVQELGRELEELHNQETTLTEQNSELMLTITTATQNMQFAQEHVVRIQEEMQGIETELAEIMENSQSVDLRIAQKQEEILKVEESIRLMKIQVEELQLGIEQKTKEKEELNQKHKAILNQREDLSTQMNALDKECFRLNNQKEKLSEKIDSYVNYMWEQYELTYHAAEELKTEVAMSVAEMKDRIKALKGQMKSLGDVNVNAIEQYKEVQERYELLKNQHDDLILAAEVLVGIIEELDTEMRKQFEEQFAEIRVRFDKVFKELFGGGRGTLELTEDEDILQAGIRIVAQPPGKKLQNMMQLSGGEKALTAIALLFAIQSLKPSPFCLLDEIEAALDDSNVGRYADYLHKLTKDTQFIVITHRRGTMNASDILYGITMQEKGVSTLVSVNLLDEKDIAN